MKLIKTASALLGAALLLGVSTVSAVSQGYNYIPVSFALTLRQQNSDISTNATTFYSFTTVKLGNKDILNILADMASVTNWPSGAQLGYDGYRLVVLDKTGTNVLDKNNGYYHITLATKSCSSGGVTSGTYVDKTPGSDSERYFEQGYLYIYDDNNYYIDMTGYGLTKETYNDQWFLNAPNKYNDSFNFSPVCTGYFNGYSAILTGDISASGKWSNVNN